MKRTIIAAVATAALCVPALAQQSQNGSQGTNTQSSQQSLNQSGQQMSPQQMNATQLRQLQQALDNKGFNAGRSDGKWGPETEAALKKFAESQNMPWTGEIDAKTVTALGLNASDFGMRNNYGNASTTGQAPNGSSTTHQPNNNATQSNNGSTTGSTTGQSRNSDSTRQQPDSNANSSRSSGQDH
jgi:lysozyme family protein